MVLIFVRRASGLPGIAQRIFGAPRLATVALVLLLAACGQPSAAQFLGSVSPQTTEQTLLNGVACAPITSAVIRNIGQTNHYLSYSVSGGTVIGFQIQMDFSHDGVTFQRLSEIGKLAPGLLFASGWYPQMRVNIVSCTVDTGTPAITVRYSGASSSFGLPEGITNLSGTRLFELASGADATVGAVFTIPSPTQNIGGRMVFTFDTLPTGDADYTVSVSPQSTPGGGQIPHVSYSFSASVGGAGAQRVFVVPNIPGSEAVVRYGVSVGAVGGTYSLNYVFGDAATPNAVKVTTPALTSVGAGRIFDLCADASTTIADFALPVCAPRELTIELVVSGAPTTCTMEVEGRIHSGWFSLSGPIDCTVAANQMFHIINRPVLSVRQNLTALAGGASPSVRMIVYGVN